jgi:hypothetical protein
MEGKKVREAAPIAIRQKNKKKKKWGDASQFDRQTFSPDSKTDSA